MAITSIPSLATEAPPLFAGRAGPLRSVAFTGLGRPLYPGTLPASLQVVVGGAAHSLPPTYSGQGTLQVAPYAIGTTINRSA
jgi:hypothetical protein